MTLSEYIHKARMQPDPELRKSWGTQLVIQVKGHPACKAIVITIARQLIPSYYLVPLKNGNTQARRDSWSEIDQQVMNVHKEIQEFRAQKRAIQAKKRTKKFWDNNIRTINAGLDKPLHLPRPPIIRQNRGHNNLPNKI